MKTNIRTLKQLSALISATLLVLPAFGQETDTTGDDEEVFELSPFEVVEDSNLGYMATTTLAGSRLRTDLRDLGSAISVVTQEFMEDTGATDASEILIYTTNTEAGGASGNYSGGSTDGGQLIDRGARVEPQNSTRVRGLSQADRTRDYFLTDVPMDSYNTQRVDIQRGPNSILFGLGSPAGIINNSLKTPNMTKDTNQVRFRMGRWGTIRGEVDFDRAVIPDTLGIRVIGLYEEEKYRQDPAYSQDERYFVSGKWTPKLFKNGRTVVKLSYEDGEIKSNRPRVNPPKDLLGFWFNPQAMNKQVWSPISGVRPYDSPTYPVAGDPDFVNSGGFWNDAYARSGMGRWFAGMAAVFNDHASAEQGGNGLPAMMFRTGITGPNAGTMMGIENVREGTTDPSHFYNTNAGRNLSGFWVDQELSDRTTFDFYNQLLEGPNKMEWRNFDAFNASLVQTFFDDLLGIELVYDEQDSDWGDYNTISWDAYGIAIDYNEHIANGEPNPNFGRPYVASDSIDGSQVVRSREAYRATGFLNIDFNDYVEERSWMSSLLGRHTLTGTYTLQNIHRDNRQLNGWGAGPEIVQYASELSTGLDNTGGKGSLSAIHYLGGAIDHMTSASGADIPNISANHFPATSGTALVYDNVTANNFINVPMTTLNWFDNPEQLWRKAELQLEDIESKVFVWQGWFLNDHVVGLVGWREDEASTWTNNNPPASTFNKMVLPNDASFVLPDDPQNTVKGDAVSWGVVVHSPQFVNDFLPLDMEISLSYNESSNFRPASGRVNVYNEALPAPSGDTTDYGVTISMLENKFVMKMNWYETTQASDSVRALNYWHAGNMDVRLINGFQHGSNGADIINQWFGYSHPDGAGADADGDGIWDTGAYEAGNADALPRKTNYGEATRNWVGGDRQVRRDWLTAQPDSTWVAGFDPKMVSSWNYERIGDYRWKATAPPGVTSLSDTKSEGFEMELIYNPSRNWRIALNVAQQQAVRSNVAGDLDEFFASNLHRWTDGAESFARSPHEQDGFADIQFYNGFNTTYGSEGRNRMIVPYLTQINLSGAAIPELREWRANLVTNYRFSDGILKNLSIGGAIRWQDDISIGFPVIEDPEAGLIYDVANPYMQQSDTQFDVWFRYGKKLMNNKIDWTIQINVRDVFGSQDLIPVSVQPDGRVATFRMPNPNVWWVTNTFKF